MHAVSNTLKRHHAESIGNLLEMLKKDATVLAVILGGSIAHGFSTDESDIDVSIVIDSESYQKRKRERKLNYYNTDACTYNGYIDGKFIDADFLKLVAIRGSDPARYAFKDSTVLFSTIPDLERIISDIVRYPVEEKQSRIRRFAAQLSAWEWYYKEAIRHENRYLAALSVQKTILFGARIILVLNETFYPYHKWLLRVLKNVENKPHGMVGNIERLLRFNTVNTVTSYCNTILSFAAIDRSKIDWTSEFIQDSELNWIDGAPPIDDV